VTTYREALVACRMAVGDYGILTSAEDRARITERRNRLLRAAFAEGATVRELASVSTLAVSTVHTIVDGARPASGVESVLDRPVPADLEREA
jgi:hypothetical protein